MLVLLGVFAQRMSRSSQQFDTDARAKKEQLLDESEILQEVVIPVDNDSDEKNEGAGRKKLDSKPTAEKNRPRDRSTDVSPSKKPGEESAKAPAVEATIPVEAERPAVAAIAVGHIESKAINITATLAQRISHYDPKKAQTVWELIPGIEELVGVPIRINETERKEITKLLKRSVTLRKQQETTVARILDVLFGKVGLAYDVESDGIRLRRSRVGAKNKSL